MIGGEGDLLSNRMTDERPTHLDLFSGIGGFSIAAQCAGFRTVAFVEKDPFCQKLLSQHWPTIPCYGDIHHFGGRSLRPISLLTGGFPCQPFSQAGEQRGKEDDRYLWPEMLRVIQRTEPDWIIGENVAGLDGLGLDDCISDLEASGYEVAPPLEIPACAVGAIHRRIRVWIIANRYGMRKSQLQRGKPNGRRRDCDGADAPGGFAANGHTLGVKIKASNNERAEYLTDNGAALRIGPLPSVEDFGRLGWTPEPEWFRREPGLARLVHGLSRRPHKTRREAAGNAIVPQVAFQIIKAIREEIRKTE